MHRMSGYQFSNGLVGKPDMLFRTQKNDVGKCGFDRVAYSPRAVRFRRCLGVEVELCHRLGGCRRIDASEIPFVRRIDGEIARE